MKSLLSSEDTLKLSQKSSSLNLTVSQAQYFLTLKVWYPQCLVYSAVSCCSLPLCSALLYTGTDSLRLPGQPGGARDGRLQLPPGLQSLVRGAGIALHYSSLD